MTVDDAALVVTALASLGSSVHAAGLSSLQGNRSEIVDSVFHFALVTTDHEALGVFAYEKGDWLPGDVIEQGGASLRVVDVIPPEPRQGDGLEVGLLRVEPLDESMLRETLARYERAHVEHDGDGLRSCFHDDAIIESVASNGEPLGPDETAELVRKALADGVYSIREWHYEEHTPEIVLVTVGARHRFPPSGTYRRKGIPCRRRP